jgi:hypothetical protein
MEKQVISGVQKARCSDIALQYQEEYLGSADKAKKM